MNIVDCRSEEGITVGLIDSIISICRILSKRSMDTVAIQEALCDLNSDEDVFKVTCEAAFAAGYKETAGEVKFA